MKKAEIRKMKSMYEEHAEEAKKELERHEKKAQNLGGVWAARYEKEQILPLLEFIEEVERYGNAMKKKLLKKAAEGAGASHDAKRPPGACVLSTLPEHALSFGEIWAVTPNTLRDFKNSKSGISGKIAQLGTAVNVLPEKRRRNKRFVPIEIIVDAIIKTASKDVTFVIRDQIISALQMKWGQYTIDICKIRDDLVWCSQFHPDEDARDAFKLQYGIVSKQIIRLAVAHKMMHYCTRAGCKHASEPFMYCTMHGGGRPENLSCPDIKCPAHWCVICRKPHHPHIPCDMKKRREEHNARMRSAYPADGKIRLMACPKCKCLHTKDDACDHVTCNLVHGGIRCNTKFCFHCGARGHCRQFYLPSEDRLVCSSRRGEIDG